ncbi:efflux RND transporter periplasmic adaptor subunit [Pseudoxanthomonas suwonensis]|uniref:efflux RND transporter periplasmic adaptor subunit n=1 Tax=Pseudoxanthomonas suwonensis TaxID=314722 RepID=UPI00138F4EE0|nr:efflux RND transporter periplasmic adaptor subunit [Pseudoxanthomonas suwonensis]KAF1705687.1 efflux transporter periplasmic adaptor subunit [Pseudoxanthomonas suwonensis]
MAVRVPAVVLCGLLALAGCDRQAAGPGSGAGAIPVVTTVVQPRPWSDTVQGLGTVRARESVTLTAKVSEIVEQVHFESGQKVVAGQPLVTLRVDAQRAALMEAEAAAAEAEQQYRRLQSLAGQQLVSQATLDTQRATRDAAVARVRQMQSDIGDRQVRAPFSGVLGIRQVSPGALLTPNAVIATLDDIARVYVDFQVPETELSRVAANAVVAARGAAWPGRTFEGRVQTVEARIDPQTRAVTVRAAFDNPEGLLRPGMLLDVSLFQPPREALVVPELAVVQVGRDSFVYRVDGEGVVEQVPVRTGLRREGMAEILEGLAAGDRIVVEGTGKLRPGVKVADAAAPAPAADGAEVREEGGATDAIAPGTGDRG